MKKGFIAAGVTTLALLLSGCVVKPEKQNLDKYTIMVYMCGADLESGYDGYSTNTSQAGYATMDLNEILSVSGQPDDVNIIIQTGGAKSWACPTTPQRQRLRR